MCRTCVSINVLGSHLVSQLYLFFWSDKLRLKVSSETLFQYGLLKTSISWLVVVVGVEDSVSARVEEKNNTKKSGVLYCCIIHSALCRVDGRMA